MSEDQGLFQYLAFDDHTGALLAYGRTAIQALSRGDHLAPHSPIKIILAGSDGPKIWAESHSYPQACALVDGKPGPEGLRVVTVQPARAMNDLPARDQLGSRG